MMERERSDTLPPVPGALSVCPGPSEYDHVMQLSGEHIDPGEQHNAFIRQLMVLMMEYGVRAVERLVLSKGPGGRDSLGITIGIESEKRSFRIVLPFRTEPFGDPGWVAAEILKQSHAAGLDIYPEQTSPGHRYRNLMTQLVQERERSGGSLSDVNELAYTEALGKLWSEMTEDEQNAFE